VRTYLSGSTEATKIKIILQRYVIYISDQITVPYLNTETGNRRLNIVDGMFSLEGLDCRKVLDQL
jgi:hypothetical protein